MSSLFRVLLLASFLIKAVYLFSDLDFGVRERIITNDFLHNFRLARSSDKKSNFVRGLITFPNGTVLHANRHSSSKDLEDDNYATTMLHDLLHLPQLSGIQLGPVRIGRGQHEPDDRLLRAVIILPDGRRFRGFRAYYPKSAHHSRYINRGNLGAFIYNNENSQEVMKDQVTPKEIENKRKHDSLYLRNGGLGAYIYGSSKEQEQVAQCSIKKNIETRQQRRYLVLHQEPCEPNQQHKLWKLNDGREIVYYGEPEYVKL